MTLLPNPFVSVLTLLHICGIAKKVWKRIKIPFQSLCSSRCKPFSLWPTLLSFKTPFIAVNGNTSTLGTRGFSRVRREFSVLAEGQHISGRRPKPRVKPLARSGAFYLPRWPLSFFIGLHLRQSDWKSPTVIMWAGTWGNVQRPTLSLAKQVRV